MKQESSILVIAERMSERWAGVTALQWVVAHNDCIAAVVQGKRSDQGTYSVHGKNFRKVLYGIHGGPNRRFEESRHLLPIHGRGERKCVLGSVQRITGCQCQLSRFESILGVVVSWIIKSGVPNTIFVREYSRQSFVELSGES